MVPLAQRVHNQNGIVISSAVFARVTTPTDTNTNTKTDRLTMTANFSHFHTVHKCDTERETDK